MSGPSGCGKTFEAERLAAKHKKGVIVSADHHFCPDLLDALDTDEYLGIPFKHLFQLPVIKAQENYAWDPNPEAIKLAHAKCGRAFYEAVSADDGIIIVDNTNIWIGEKAPYYAVAQWYGIDVSIIRMETPLSVCLERSVHKVPRQIIERMWHVHHARNDAGYNREELPWWQIVQVD